MAWTAERRERQMETMAAKKKLRGKNGNGTVKTIEAVQSEYHDTTISVDWEHLPMPEAQTADAKLRKEFERAGEILNSRSMPDPGSYTCYMCESVHLGDPRGKDDSYIHPRTGLAERVRICGENCWLAYMDFRIKERSLRNDLSVGLIDVEGYQNKVDEYLATKRSLQSQKMLKER